MFKQAIQSTAFNALIVGMSEFATTVGSNLFVVLRQNQLTHLDDHGLHRCWIGWPHTIFSKKTNYV